MLITGQFPEMNNALIVLDKLQDYLDTRKAILKGELNNYPAGKFYIKSSGGHHRYYLKQNGKEHSYPKKDPGTANFARKVIVEKELEAVSLCSTQIKQTIKELRSWGNINDTRRIERILALFSEERLNLSPAERKWIDTIEPAMDYNENKRIYCTKSGLMVRSKSERTIADCLDEYGLVYKYEAPIVTEYGIFYADFTVRKPIGKVVVWEHFGLMENESYFQHTMQKIEGYRRAGYVQHTNLICTYEEDIKSEDTIRRIIEERLLI